VYICKIIYTHLLMRTNIVIDDELMEKALEVSNAKTKKDVVEEALTLLIRLKQQMKLRALRGKLNWEGNLTEMRTDL
jgi:Arc/MetJ family transcription regulator